MAIKVTEERVTKASEELLTKFLETKSWQINPGETLKATPTERFLLEQIAMLSIQIKANDDAVEKKIAKALGSFRKMINPRYGR